MSGSASGLEPIVQEETKFPQGSRVIPINPASKYILIIPVEALPEDDDELTYRMEKFADVLDMWWQGGNPFFIMTDEIRLVKVGEVDLLLDDEDDEEKT